MSAKITIILGILIVASALANVYLFQKTASLENTVAQLQVTNRALKDNLSNDKNNQTSPAIGSSPQVTGNLPYFSPQQQSSKPLNTTSESITAVAVKAVPVTDGFFQTVQYQGTVMDITVDIRDGRGLVLVNTEIPTGVDFQTSARTSVKIAQSMTGVDLSDKDVIFSIKAKGENSTASDLQAVDGPSAGAAMTVLLAAELGAIGNNNAGLKQDVVMTGTINTDGTVGPVGGVPEKAIAAGQYGAKTFLVPAGQAVYNEQTCEKKQEGIFIYQTCRSQEKPLSDYTEKNYGMKVIEVKNIKEALTYFQS